MITTILCMQVGHRRALLSLRRRSQVWTSGDGTEVTGRARGQGTGGPGLKTWMSDAALGELTAQAGVRKEGAREWKQVGLK